MEETYLLNVEGVKKKILHGGHGELPDFKEGSKIVFHFQTLKDDFERMVIDDSRESGIPMEIIVGKMFKIEVWEILLTSMRIGEVAEFWCDPIHTGMYALVSKSMRKIAKGMDPLEGQKHRCGMGNMFDYHSTGYADLDELQRTPQALIFIMELFKESTNEAWTEQERVGSVLRMIFTLSLSKDSFFSHQLQRRCCSKVEDPSEYKRDTWAMNKEEKLMAIPRLHTEGNRLVLSRNFEEAAEKYQEAVICLRNVQAKEKPQEEEWLHLEKLINPLVLNYCQCQLELGEYYEVLEHTTDLLQKDNENVKAYFKRAKAHAAVWNEKEARKDFMRVTQLDPSLAAAVRKELKLLGEKMRRKHVEELKRYQGIFDQPVPKGGTEVGAGEETKWLSKGHEVVLDNRAVVEESRPEALNPKREAVWPGVGEKDGETEQGNRDEKETGGLIRKEGEMDKADSAPQAEQEEMVTETGDEEQESQAQQKDLSFSGEEKASCETSRPNQQMGFGGWEPEHHSSPGEEKASCETSRPNQQLMFWEWEPKDHRSSGEEKASCETSRPNQLLGFGEWEPKDHSSSGEEKASCETSRPNQQLMFGEWEPKDHSSSGEEKASCETSRPNQQLMFWEWEPKDHRSSGEEKASCETSRPNQLLGFGEWEPKDHSSSGEERASCETSRPNQQLKFGEWGPKDHSFSGEEKASCETSRPNQLLGFGEWEPKDHSSSGEEKASCETSRPNQLLGFGEWEPKDHSSSGEEKASCETSRPNQQLKFGEWGPKDHSSSREAKASCETSRPNQQLKFGEWEPKDHSFSGEEKASCETSRPNQQLKFGEWEPKDHSSSGEEKASCETSRPNQQLKFGEWEPKDHSSSGEEKASCETSRLNQLLGFGECEPKVHSFSGEEMASCETCRPNQLLGFGEWEPNDHSSPGEEKASCESCSPNQQLWFRDWEPKEEQEKAEETMTLGAQELNGVLGFTTLKEKQGKRIHRHSGKEVEGASGHFLASTEDMLNQGCSEAKGSFLGAEREEDARCGNGETQAGDYSRPPEETGCAAENFKEWGRVESSEEIFEEDFFEALQEGSEREVRVTTDLSLREESFPDWWDCGGQREESSTAEKGEHRIKMAWEGQERETDDRSSPVQGIHGYENGCCPGLRGAGTDPKERFTGAENCREGIQDESPKTELNLGAEFSWEQRDERNEEAARWVKEKTKVEGSSWAQKERREDGAGLECLEDEMCFRIEKFKVGMGEESSDRNQDKEDFHWEWPENTGGITHLGLKEESLSPWSSREATKGEGGDPHSTRGKDTGQARCSVQMAEPGVKSVPNVWAAKQPSPAVEEAQGNRE